MTLDQVLNTALQAHGTTAVLLLNEVYVPIAGRGDLTEADVQSISRLLSWTDIGSTGQIRFEQQFLHFHHAESHTLILVRNKPCGTSPVSTERVHPPSAVSTSVETPRVQLDPLTGDG